MPKEQKQKYYAVAVGRDAPKIYMSWEECLKRVTRYPRALHRSFSTLTEAEEWLASKADITALYATLAPKQDRMARKTKELPSLSGSDDQALPNDSPSRQNGNEFDSTQPAPSVVLSPEQSAVLTKVKEGKNVFFTGSAGTGKSVLLREIIKLHDGSDSSVAITASTGIAAVNIGGCTLHSWAGIGLGTEPVKKFVGRVLHQAKYQNVLDRWREVQTLIIDEISMIDGQLFDNLEHIARELRDSTAPFGGIQLVLCGDFCQLPPVSGKDENGTEVPATFAFDARSWDLCIGAPTTLTKVFRQKDQTFANMLNEMRYGRMNESTIQIFKSLSRPVTYTDGIEPTELFSTRYEVSNANRRRLQQLPTEPQTYLAQDWAGVDSKGQQISRERMSQMLDRLVAPPKLTIKVGAQVMLIKNLVQGVLVNGSIGRVVHLVTPREAEASRTEIAKIESRESKDKANTGNQDIPQELLQSEWKWPVVQFISGDRLMVIPTEFTINNADGGVEARRLQLPLILAWALSVHKSQGQTLERVRVDLKRTFEKGQAYVALSRATNMEHLQVLNFEPQKVMADPKVLAWYGAHTNTSDHHSDDEWDEDSGIF